MEQVEASFWSVQVQKGLDISEHTGSSAHVVGSKKLEHVQAKSVSSKQFGAYSHVNGLLSLVQMHAKLDGSRHTGLAVQVDVLPKSSHVHASSSRSKQ